METPMLREKLRVKHFHLVILTGLRLGLHLLMVTVTDLLTGRLRVTVRVR